jgi:hypothetical protein
MLVGGVGYGPAEGGNRQLLCEEPGVSVRKLHQVTRTRVNPRRGRPPTRPEMSSGIVKQRTHGHCEMKEDRK